MALARTTVANYKVRLKKLREILPLITDEEKKRKCLNEIEVLTSKLGKEMTDLEIQLAKGPGRPKIREDFTEEFALAKKMREEEEQAGKKKEGADFSKEGRERRAKQLREQAHAVTLVEEVKRSDEELQALISMNTEAEEANKERVRLEELANEELANEELAKKGPNATG